jgi:hypothetical protein
METPPNRPPPRRHCCRCRAPLVVRYRPHLFPRWLWRPVESLVAGEVHGHVIEGMRRRATGASQVAAAPVSAALPPALTAARRRP